MSKGSFWLTVVASAISYAMVLLTSLVTTVEITYVFWIAHGVCITVCFIMFFLIWFYQVKERRNGN